MFLKHTFVGALILSAVACSNSSTNYSNAIVADGLEPVLIDRNWVLRHFEGDDGNKLALSDESTSEFTIRFSSAIDSGGRIRRTVGGVIVCNGYQGTYGLEASVLSLTDMIATEISCDGAEEQPAQMFERVLFNTNSTAVVFLERDRLEITSGTNEKLIFIDADSLQLKELGGGDLASQCISIFPEPRYQVIRNQQAFDELYGRLVKSPCRLEGPPQVNFAISTVLFVAHEIVSVGGYSIEVNG